MEYFYITETQVGSFWFGDLTREILFWVSALLNCFSSHNVALPQTPQFGSPITMVSLPRQTPWLDGRSHTTHWGVLWHSTVARTAVMPYGKAKALGAQQKRNGASDNSSLSSQGLPGMQHNVLNKFWVKPFRPVIEKQSKEVFPFRQYRRVSVVFLLKR